MSESDKPRRQQIDEAMAAIHHQLERLREGPTLGEPSDDRTVIAELEAEYQALKEARHGLGRMIAHLTRWTATHGINAV